MAGQEKDGLLPIASDLKAPGNVLRMIDGLRGDFSSLGALARLRQWGFQVTTDPEIFFAPALDVWIVSRREKVSRRFLGFAPSQGTEYKGVFVLWRLPAERAGRVQKDRQFLKAVPNCKTGRVRFHVPGKYVQ